MSINRIAVLMTSYNRREVTLSSLAALFQQRGSDHLQITTFLVDDGCTDGTGDAVRSGFPQVRVLQGDGTLFWNGGMRMAFDAALKEGFDAYILLNDDTVLLEDAVERLVQCATTSLASGRPAIVVGSTLSRVNGVCSYGGFVKQAHGLSIRLDRVLPDPSRAVPCDTMNGNFVLIPAAVANAIGNIEKKFRHQFGDVDYGLRAKRAGFQVLVAPGYIGICPANTSTAAWRDSSLPFMKRWKSLMSPKGVPLKEWLLFTRRHFGWRWVHYAASPYLKTIASSLVPGSRTRRARNASAPIR
jgi:GT2 family glycosyltransferase